MADEITYETSGRVAIITMNRPAVHNAVNPAMSAGLRAAFGKFREDRELWAAVLTGAGDRAFTAGADLKVMAARSSGDFSDSYWWPPEDRGHVEVYKPVVAAVNGYCYAEGLNLLCAITDIRIVSESATFCYAEVLRGFSGTGYAIELLPRQVPYVKAMEWLLTGKVFDAQEAYRAGLVNEVVPLAQVKDRALEVAQQFASLPPIAVRAIKEAVVRGTSMDLPNAISFANSLGVLTRYTQDAREGPQAFTEKRPPVYKGR